MYASAVQYSQKMTGTMWRSDVHPRTHGQTDARETLHQTQVKRIFNGKFAGGAAGETGAVRCGGVSLAWVRGLTVVVCSNILL